ncbi:hypothetical protein RD792_008117 [Penstemon davidsonii]|uniref:(1->3)-beta-glucan endohydrolase n=1 Tax=Penstemon davidsonii TaxID=160366 RepID=A0ABR0D844_9LAMI|nr:hypothetical protein RD792_008117 [Penstemon davidsonii]
MVSFAPKSIKYVRFNAISAFRLSSILSTELQNAFGWTRKQTTYASSTVEECAYDDHIPDDSKVTEKDTALRLALSKLSGEFGKESMLSLQRFFGARRAPVISTGSIRLDQALGTGGLPKGRMVEIYGQEASGKTTLALHVIKEAQKLGGYCAYLDVENALDPSLAESIGVNTDNLLISQPDSAENLLSVVDTLTKSGSVSVIVVDSVRKKLKLVEGSVRADEVTCGGNALKFYAAIRLRISRMALLKTEDKATGLGICVQVVKNKLAPSMAKAELSIKFGKGFCCESEALDLACEHGVIVKEGNNYFIKGKILESKEEALRFLAANDGALDDIIRTLSNCSNASNGNIDLLLTRNAHTGACYGTLGDNLPPATEVIALLNKNNIKRIRPYNPNPSVLQALKGQRKISVIVGVQNEDIIAIANDLTVAKSWVQNNVIKYGNVNFRYIAVGNEISPLNGGSSIAPNVPSAMRNIYKAIFVVGLGRKVKISTALSMEILGNSYPPSSSISNPNDIRLDYALFTSRSTVVRDGQYHYQNLFDAMVDAVYAALEKVGGADVEVVVSETGWPSAGGTATTIDSAKTYNSNLIKNVHKGTPRKPGKPIEAYIFDLIDENQKSPELEKHWGVFLPNKQPKYPLKF